MASILDYSLARPDPAQVKAKGYVGVMRYVAPAEDASKVITPAEYHALLTAGLPVGLNWEWYANRAREGSSAGTADAQSALSQAKALGYTGAIYFSVDYDAPESDQPLLNAYFAGCASIIGKGRLGCYAGYWPLSRLFDAGLTTYGWQTLAWSGNNREGRAHLFQTGATDFGGQADIDTVLKPNWLGTVSTPNYKMQQAKDIWNAATGIHAAWLRAFENNIVLGPPVNQEINTVDWNGNPLIRQDFSQGWIEYLPGGITHGYQLNGKTIITLW